MGSDFAHLDCMRLNTAHLVSAQMAAAIGVEYSSNISHTSLILSLECVPGMRCV